MTASKHECVQIGAKLLALLINRRESVRKHVRQCTILGGIIAPLIIRAYVQLLLRLLNT